MTTKAIDIKTPTRDSVKMCCICGVNFTGWGNNPAPFPDIPASDRCCDDCNARFVIPARLMGRPLIDSDVLLLRHFAQVGRTFVTSRAARLADALKKDATGA